MKWEIPETEEAWQELLSAYLDGELDGETRRELEDYLARDARRARQFAELRALSGLLGEWTIEAPEPDAGFVSRIAGLAKRQRGESDDEYGHEAPGWRRWLMGFRVPWPVAAMLFVAGMLAGAWGMQRLRGLDAIQPPRPTAVAMAAAPVSGAASISDAQAERLWRQIHSGGPSAIAQSKSAAERVAQLKKFNRQWMEARRETTGNSLGSFRELRQMMTEK